MKDAIGNRLQVGNLVQVSRHDGVRLNGHIAEINEGGLVAVRGARKPEDLITPGICKVTVTIEAESDPRSGVCPFLLRLVDPAEQQKTQ